MSDKHSPQTLSIGPQAQKRLQERCAPIDESVATPPIPPTPPPSPWVFTTSQPPCQRSNDYVYKRKKPSSSPALNKKTSTTSPLFCHFFTFCRLKLDQVVVKRQISAGVRLYSQQQYSAAVGKWKKSLSKVSGTRDKFCTLSYLCEVHLICGKYREAKEYASEQLQLAEDLEDPALWAEGYCNMARTQEQVGNYEKSVHCCRQSFYHLNEVISSGSQPRRITAGQVHICIANAFLGLSNFFKAVEHFNLAFRISRESKNKEIELQVYLGFGRVFTLLQDWEKAVRFANKALRIAKSFQLSDLNSRYQRIALLDLSTPLRKIGQYKESRRACQNAMRLSSSCADTRTHARSYLTLGDLYRFRSDANRAYISYRNSEQLSSQLGDQYCQVQAMLGMGKSLQLLAKKNKDPQHSHGGLCLCRPLALCNRALQLATDIGSKHLMRMIHLQLISIYTQLGDEENKRLQERLAYVLVDEMELNCASCRDPIGTTSGNSLDALPCSHLFHSSCAQELLKKSSESNRRRKRLCPECRRTVTSHMSLMGHDELKHLNKL